MFGDECSTISLRGFGPLLTIGGANPRLHFSDMQLSMSLQVPPSVGPFRLISQLGQGGFAPVFRAEEIHEGKILRDVAIKLFLRPLKIRAESPEAIRWRDGVIDEARALCRVEHPNIVRFYSLTRDDPRGLVGLIMEYIPGENLGTVLRDKGPLSPLQVLDVGIDMAWALAAVHNAGLVHRDIKPENIIAARTGFKLIDFGIVVDECSSAVSEGEYRAPPLLIGTPGFVAPEYHKQGARTTYPSPAGDLYALGVTLHMLLTGKLPSGTSLNRSNAFWELISLLLAPDPNMRPRHADWVARELLRLRGNIRVPAPTPPDPIPIAASTTPDSLLSEAPALRHNPPLAGRQDVFDLLSQVAREAALGQLRFVLISGPLGVGRTRMLSIAMQQAEVRPDCLIFGHGSPERRGPLRPLRAALRSLPDDNQAACMLLAAIDRALSPTLLPTTDQGELALEVVEDALLVIAKADFFMLALDDVQWADDATLLLLRFLAERALRGSNCKLLVVVTVRDEPNASDRLRVLLDLVRPRGRLGVRHLPLGPLSVSDSTALALGVCPLDSCLLSAVVRSAGGIPFFLVHALVAWAETGAMLWRHGSYRAVSDDILVEVPYVAELLQSRLITYLAHSEHWFPVALRVLAVVAMVGGGLPLSNLHQVLVQDAMVDSVLEILVDARILTLSGEQGAVFFAQEMLRQASLNLARQKPWFYRLHRTLLEVIASGPDAAADASFLARGYDQLGDREHARLWFARAMQAALRAGLFEEATCLGDRLAALAPDAITRGEVQLDVVRSLVLGRQFTVANERLGSRTPERELGTGDAFKRELQWRILRLRVARGRLESAEDASLVEDADKLGDLILSCEARMAVAGMLVGNEAMQWIREAVSLSEKLSPALEFSARVLRVELIYASSPRDLHQAEVDLWRALSIARETSSIWQEVHIECDLAVLEAELGRTDAAVLRLTRLSAQAEALGMRSQLRTSLHNLATCLMRTGRAEQAAEVAGRVASLALDAGDPVLQAVALSLQSYALYHAGELERALESATEAELLQREREDRMRPMTLLRRVVILEALGRIDDALADAAYARDLALLHGEHGFYVTAMLWETLFDARRGRVGPVELREAISAVEASGIGQRALTRDLMQQAATWLAEKTAPILN